MKRKRVLYVIGAILVLVAAVVILNLTLRGAGTTRPSPFAASSWQGESWRIG